jgi:hypothetical protein
MITIELRHNPFKAATTLSINGKETHLNCLGTGEGHRMEDWKDSFFPELVRKCNLGPGSGCSVLYYGLVEDFEDLNVLCSAYGEREKEIAINLTYASNPAISLGGIKARLKEIALKLRERDNLEGFDEIIGLIETCDTVEKTIGAASKLHAVLLNIYREENITQLLSEKKNELEKVNLAIGELEARHGEASRDSLESFEREISNINKKFKETLKSNLEKFTRGIEAEITKAQDGSLFTRDNDKEVKWEERKETILINNIADNDADVMTFVRVVGGFQGRLYDIASIDDYLGGSETKIVFSPLIQKEFDKDYGATTARLADICNDGFIRLGDIFSNTARCYIVDLICAGCFCQNDIIIKLIKGMIDACSALASKCGYSGPQFAKEEIPNVKNYIKGDLSRSWHVFGGERVTTNLSRFYRDARSFLDKLFDAVKDSYFNRVEEIQSWFESEISGLEEAVKESYRSALGKEKYLFDENIIEKTAESKKLEKEIVDIETRERWVRGFLEQTENTLAIPEKT